MINVPEDLFGVLKRFHREVALPDMERIGERIESRLDAKISSLRNEMLSNFDAVFQRLDRLESEYAALKAAVERLEVRVERLEQRMTAVEQKLDRMALRSELLDLKERVAQLEQRIAEIEASLE